MYTCKCLSEKFIEVFNKQRKEKMEKERERIQLMNADPFDPSVQSVIAEEIRLFFFHTNKCTVITTTHIIIILLLTRIMGVHVRSL